MGFRLPPVNSLRLFEAASRLSNFKLAADEVHLTPSAVSHGIQTLEAWLGTELFHRSSKGLSLTSAGVAYAPEIRRALTILAEATDRLPGRKATGELSISCMPTFAKKWLMPRLATFSEAYPDITVTIDTNRRSIDFPNEGVDVAIRRGHQPRSGEVWAHLLQESLVPVCAPGLRRSADIEDDVDFILASTRILVTSVDSDWSPWFESQGIHPVETAASFFVDTFQLANEAAMEGLGVTLGRKPFVDEYLANGQLIELAGPPIAAAEGYWLVGSQLSLERPEVKLFKAWIFDAIANPAVPPSPRRYVAPRSRRGVAADIPSPADEMNSFG